MKGVATTADEHCIWHDVEHAAYAADLAIYERMARRAGGPIVDLGAGTGRVSLHLAARGHRVIAVESDARLATELEARARRQGLPVDVVCADARELEVSEGVPLIVAPMQFLHIVGGRDGRRRVLERVERVIATDGRFATAILREDLPLGRWRPEPIPDVREIDGWVHSSLASEIEVRERDIALRRIRQLVSPTGQLEETTDEIVLDRFSAADLDREALEAGLRTVSAEPVPRSAEHEDSVIVTMSKPPAGDDV